MEVTDLSLLGLEASCSLFIMVLAIKLYKMKIRTHSGCCGDSLEIETSNPGAETTPMDGVMQKL
jgi:hypothetical protein